MADRVVVGRWLLDGNNVMGSRPDGWWRDRVAAKVRLTTEVGRLATTTGRPVILVFDGRPDGTVLAGAAGTVTVRFAGAGRANAADDLIVDLARDGDTVVTADRGLMARLPPGVATLGPKRLLAELGRLGAGPID